HAQLLVGHVQLFDGRAQVGECFPERRGLAVRVLLQTRQALRDHFDALLKPVTVHDVPCSEVARRMGGRGVAALGLVFIVVWRQRQKPEIRSTNYNPNDRKTKHCSIGSFGLSVYPRQIVKVRPDVIYPALSNCFMAFYSVTLPSLTSQRRESRSGSNSSHEA